MGSLYGEYIKERLGHEIVETENGFVTYSFEGQACFIRDIYVRPSHRNSSEARIMADAITKIAQEKGYKKLYASVVPESTNSTASLKVVLSYGFRLLLSRDNFILMEMDI